MYDCCKDGAWEAFEFCLEWCADKGGWSTRGGVEEGTDVGEEVYWGLVITGVVV